MSWLDNNGVSYLWGKMKTWVQAQGYLTQHQDISSKVSKTGDTMTGTLAMNANLKMNDDRYLQIQDDAKIQFPKTNTANYIEAGTDSHVMTAKNNIHLASWNGISFGSTLTSATYYNKPAVSINCRNGDLEAGGTVTSNKLSVTNSASVKNLTAENLTNVSGYVMHGRNANNRYSVIWQSSKLQFYVDNSNVGSLSDIRLKSDIEEVDPNILKAICECKVYQFKAFNRDGLISVGIIAQDLVKKCEKYGVDPMAYEVLAKVQMKAEDETLYYQIEYTQYLTFKTLYQQQQIDELREMVNELRKEKSHETTR